MRKVLLVLLVIFFGSIFAQNYSYSETFTNSHTKRVSFLEFSSDGQELYSASEDGSVIIWNTSDSSRKLTYSGHSKWVNAVALSPSKNLVASASDDKTVRLWNYSGQDVAVLQGHGDWVGSVSFSPDGKWLASGSGDGAVKIWDAESYSLITTLSHNNFVRAFFNHDGRYLVSITGDNSIKLWTTANWQVISELIGHNDGVMFADFSSDGKYLATGSKDGKIKIWDWVSGKEVHDISAHDDYVVTVRFHPSGKLLASASRDNTVKTWDVETGNLLQTLHHSGNTLGLAFSPDGNSLMIGTSTNNIVMWQESSDTVANVYTPSSQQSEVENNESSIFDVVNAEEEEEWIDFHRYFGRMNNASTLEVNDLKKEMAGKTFEGRFWVVDVTGPTFRCSKSIMFNDSNELACIYLTVQSPRQLGWQFDRSTVIKIFSTKNDLLKYSQRDEVWVKGEVTFVDCCLMGPFKRNFLITVEAHSLDFY